MPEASVFTSNRSQAVRIPKSVEFPGSVKKVSVIPVGKSRLITPVEAVWDTFFEGPAVSDDFLEERVQPSQQQRESL